MKAILSKIVNQCVSAGRDVPAAPRTPIHYDADGNMTDDGEFAYSYDAENRLVSVVPLSPAVGSLAVENRYDHRHRRVRKTVRRYDGATWETAETHTFVWDGGDIALEKVEFADGTVRTCEYFWGVDRSGAERGAGGVGGLLAVSVDGAFYVPCYDHNGNVVMYVSEIGGVAAQYVYDPYGNMIESHGNLAGMFPIGFSTKYLDRETGLIAYQRRFYSPALGRWLNRDPIEEDGGENLYAFCGNNPTASYDRDGCAYFALRKLKGFVWLGPLSHNPLFDVLNIEIAHELVFLGEHGEKGSSGYSDKGIRSEEDEDLATMTYHITDGGYDDCVMKKAIDNVYFDGHDYSVFWFAGHIKKCNCQDYCSALRRKYAELIKDKKVRCECGLE